MKKGNFIYIGPTIPVLGLKKNTVYRSPDLPNVLEKFAQTKAVLRSLYVSTKDLAKANKQLTTKGSLEYTATQEMLAIAKTTPQ